jgi:hypothetical protein
MLIETAPGVVNPVLSRGRPAGSVIEIVAVIVPSVATWALVILNIRPGLTNWTALASA